MTSRLLALALLVALVPAANAQVYTSDWSTRDAGGIIAGSAATYSLSATIAQIDGQRPAFGGTFTLVPGFWGGQPRCPADLTGDDLVDLQDFFAFFGCFDLTTPCADIDLDGSVDLNDFFAFLNALDTGC